MLNRVLLESQKTGFLKKIKAAHYVGSEVLNQSSLIKKKKNQTNEDLKKKKRKTALVVASKYCEGVKLLSKQFGDEKYVTYIRDVIRILMKSQLYQKMQRCCDLAVKLRALRSFPQIKQEILSMGLICSLQNKNTDKAFYYIRGVLKEKCLNLSFASIILNQIINSIRQSRDYKSFLSKQVQK